MKNLVFIIVLVNYATAFSQSPDAQLFQTWYLYETGTDLGDSQSYETSDMLSLTINEDLYYTGNDGCVQFDGQFVYSNDTLYDFYLTMESYNRNPENCEGGNDSSTTFPDFYEGAVIGAQLYDESQDSSVLILEVFPGFYFSFTNQLLSLYERSLNQIRFYPNPVLDKLYISSEDLRIESYKLFDLGGRLIDARAMNDEISVDVSQLSSGLYFVELQFTEGNLVSKFYKK